MSRWCTLALDSESWAPTKYMPEPLARAAPPTYSGSLVRLADVADFVPAQSSAQAGGAVVTPRGVSPQTGAVQPSDRGPTGTIFRLGADLQGGDVLVPLLGKGPCVFVVDDHRGLAFSRGFAALRPRDGVRGSALWGLLSSTTGIEARHQLDVGSVVHRLSANDLAALMLPDLGSLPSTEALLPSPPVDEIAAAAVVSRWRQIRLTGTANWEPGRLLDPAALAEGVRITELGQVRAGRLDARTFADHPFPKGQPAFRPSDVGRLTTPRWWTVAEEPDLAGPNSILVGALSLRVAHFEGPVAIARDILVLDVQPWADLSAEEVRDRLLAYLGSAAGQRRLAAYKTGATIPLLSKRALLTLRVPPPDELPSAKPTEAELLATRLEQALWN